MRFGRSRGACLSGSSLRGTFPQTLSRRAGKPVLVAGRAAFSTKNAPALAQPDFAARLEKLRSWRPRSALRYVPSQQQGAYELSF
jgi:hypothetical protein